MLLRSLCSISNSSMFILLLLSLSSDQSRVDQLAKSSIGPWRQSWYWGVSTDVLPYFLHCRTARADPRSASVQKTSEAQRLTQHPIAEGDSINAWISCRLCWSPSVSRCSTHLTPLCGSFQPFCMRTCEAQSGPTIHRLSSRHWRMLGHNSVQNYRVYSDTSVSSTEGK